MSQIALIPNASGTGTFSIASPNSNTNRTLTLPDETGTLATEADVAAAESMVLLGTLTTGTQTISGLTLTGYKQLFFDINGVSHNGGTGTTVLIGAGAVHTNVTASDLVNGGVWVSLWTGVAMPMITRNALPTGQSGQIAQTGYSNATTSVDISFGTGSMDAGSVRVYGVK